jgi:fibro-slime domain-containing protein
LGSIVGLSIVLGCASVTPGSGPGSGGGGAGSGGGAGTGMAGGGGAPPPPTGAGGIAVTTPGVCGNGERTADEACDDGNTMDGDGCSANCKVVERGFSCQPPGQPCHRVARCGDGIVVLPELCDDGNTTAGDGCSATCKIEIGWKCSGDPSVCTHTTCGDGKIEGTESCEDGNALPFDGCSGDCRAEPDCSGASCVSKCGDGIVVNEACDDGNNVDGDGCSSTCTIEPGYTCTQPALGNNLLVPVIYRDFRFHMPTDFQPSALGRSTALTGIVQAKLDAQGKPVYAGNVTNSYIESTASFAEWYRDTAGINHSTPGKLTLWNNNKGAYVNRYGPNGEQWALTAMAYYCGNVGAEMLDANGMPIPCTSKYNDPVTNPTDCDKMAAMNYTQLSCTKSGGNWVAVYQTGALDGTPLFFPVDGDNFTPASERTSASIDPPYDPNFSAEPGMPLHNFSFTSEVRYWFKYDATATYTLNFLGDDDVWLFVNKTLAVDLGGIHSPVSGSVTFGKGSTMNFGMVNGNVYEVAVFQAERQTNGSSYQLTLSGFNAAPSECTPVCGDGIIGLGEECDDGVNAGGYGKCGPGCKLSEFCGDGVVQPEFEDCDDGVNVGMPCPSGCHILIVQ